MCEAAIANIVNNILRVEHIEEAFNCYLLIRPEDNDEEIIEKYQKELAAVLVPPTPAPAPAPSSNTSNAATPGTNVPTPTAPTPGISVEQQENGLRHYLSLTAGVTNQKRLQLLLTIVENLVGDNTLPARMVCEAILSSEKLVYTNEHFWIEGFCLIRRVIGGVDYKGVREIMKVCRDKAQTLPLRLNGNILPQMHILENLLEYIFDRNACLLPAYLIVNEIQKGENSKWPHWKLAHLFSSFVESFRPCAQMISIVGHSTMRPVVEHSGCAEHVYSPWRLDRTTLRFHLKGSLPFSTVLLGAQPSLLRYVLEQPYSRDIVCDMLGLQKQHKNRCVTLEEQLVELVVIAMERSEIESASSSNSATGSTTPTYPGSGPSTSGTSSENNDDQSNCHWLWLHLSSQLIYFQLFQHASFPNIVIALHDKLQGREFRKGRDHLMWVLLQFISGSIQRNPLSNFLPVLKLYDLLYPEREPLPVPDYTKAQCTHQMAVTCIWIHLLKKAQTDHDLSLMQRPIPHALKEHHHFLQHLVVANNPGLSMGNDYRIALLCNAYSTNQEYFSRPMAALVEAILANSKSATQTLQSSPGPTTPLSMAILDSLTVHSKMSLIHSIVTHVIKSSQNKANVPLAPALVETYSRLLVYTEIESLGIKGFISQLLPTVFKNQAWGTLYTLLEMFSYRMHHIQPHYRVQLLSHLHSLAAVPHTNQTQLHLCVESTALRLITGLGSREVQPQLQRFLSEPKTLISNESEELNRALVLTLARSMHITGTGTEALGATWCKELLNTIMQNTPHSWAHHTLECFPPVLHDFFKQNVVPKENKQQLKKDVEEEYRNWTSINNENDIIAHFSVAGTPPLFLCLLFKMILETDRISPIAYKILERIGARALSVHLRKFCDCLVFEFTNSPGGQHVNKCVDTINDMIWKYNVVTIDRLVLCLALRTQEGSEAQVCFFIIQLLLLKAAEFRGRVQEFVKENSPEHWRQSNWYEKHLAFHRKYPEKFAPEEQSVGGSSGLPVFFGNVCLRFLPVFDIVTHRYLEIPQVTKSLEILLEHLGCLYKFHDRPITYLYNTLHYYERKLRERSSLKRRLVGAVLGSLKDIRPAGWALSDAYLNYLARTGEDASWVPELDYYRHMVKRVVDTMNGESCFPVADWRFNEFPNAGAHALYVTCVELMALPNPPAFVANSLLDVITKGYIVIPQDQLNSWINAIGVIMSALPESYWIVINDRLEEVISSQYMQNWTHLASPFQLFDIEETSNSLLENTFSHTLALVHAIWHHAGLGQLAGVPQLIKEKLGPLVRKEPQLLFICHLVGPFLHRFSQERPSATMDLTCTLYELLAAVDQANTNLEYMDPICDLLYHIKYMFVGDTMKTEVEGVIRRLRPALQMRLRFIAHLSIEEINTA